jgi:hypothetical protein
VVQQGAQNVNMGLSFSSYPMSTGNEGLEHEADHSSLSSAEIKDAWSYTSTPPVSLHGVVLSYAQGQCIFILKHIIHRVQNGSGAHPASYTMGTRGSFPGGKVAGA